MTTIKSYTDIEQSKKLAEILPIESADMCYINNKTHLGFLYEEYYEFGDTILRDYYPCWSLAALENLMPFQIIENNNRFGFYKVKGFNKQGETYSFCYKTNNNSFLFETSWHNNSVDAAFEMVCWLKENGKI